MSLTRLCTRIGCGRPAIATLTYVYSEQTAVLGPLATYAEPHTYDLCHEHAHGLTAPRGWEVVRLQSEFVEPPPSRDDLLALADAVREAGRPRAAAAPAASSGPSASSGPVAATEHGVVETGRRRHLRVLRDQ